MKKRTFESFKEKANLCKSRGEYYNRFPSEYSVALRREDFDEICAHMSPPSNKARTFEEIQVEALKYRYRADFQNGSGPFYGAALRLGILDKVCSHMKAKYEYWTPKKINKKSILCSTRVEFFRTFPKAYDAAQRLSILNEVCSHMKPSQNSSLAEIELMNIVKNKISTAKKIKDYKVKPYIKRFEIDIFIPELNKGIEFDGKYHHTYEYMRKDLKRSKWSDDDIRNYHEIKDAWFATKGIQILHIKEADWLKNKEGCIKRCLEFLGQSICP